MVSLCLICKNLPNCLPEELYMGSNKWQFVKEWYFIFQCLIDTPVKPSGPGLDNAVSLLP